MQNKERKNYDIVVSTPYGDILNRTRDRAEGIAKQIVEGQGYEVLEVRYTEDIYGKPSVVVIGETVKNKQTKICPECAKRGISEVMKVKMELEKLENYPDRFVCPECGYEELKKRDKN